MGRIADYRVSASGVETQPRQVSEPQADVPAATSPGLSRAIGALRILAGLLVVALLSAFVTVVPVGQRGVLLQLGSVQDKALGEGVHLLVPAIQDVRPINVQIQSEILHSHAATRDLQDVTIDLALHWHPQAELVPRIYQQVGDEAAMVSKLLKPTAEDGIKSVVATLTAEELIIRRQAFRQDLEELISRRLAPFHLAIDGVDLVQLEFSKRFRAAVEAKQVAEQDARRAAFEAARAQRQAAARVYQAEGEARAQELLQAGLSEALLERQAIEKWNGQLPLVVAGGETLPPLNLKSLIKADRSYRKKA